jgi:hypothetical protein
MTVLTFNEILLVMEGLDLLTDELRTRLASGDASVQEDLERTETLNCTIMSAASIQITQAQDGASA